MTCCLWTLYHRHSRQFRRHSLPSHIYTATTIQRYLKSAVTIGTIFNIAVIVVAAVNMTLATAILPSIVPAATVLVSAVGALCVGPYQYNSSIDHDAVSILPFISQAIRYE